MQSFRGASSGPTVCYAVVVAAVQLPSLATQVGGFLNVTIPAPPGCGTNQKVVCSADSADISNAAYLFAGNARISAANTVRLQCCNASVTNPLQPTALDLAFVFFGKVGA